MEREGSARYARRLREALRGRRVLITGASSGIGRAFALQAGAAGAHTLLVARRRDELAAVARQIEAAGGRASCHAVDLSCVREVESLAAHLCSAEAPIDVLVNNAGFSLRRDVARCSAADLQRQCAVNYLGPAALTLGLLPAMLARGGGHVVWISTIGVQTGAPLFSGYVASKAAADHFARTLRLELGRRGLSVSTVSIPLVRTPMMQPTRIYRAFPALDVENAARRIGWAVVRRPIRSAPRWSTALELAHAAAPGLLQWAFATFHDPFHRLMARRLARREGLERPLAARSPAPVADPKAPLDPVVLAERR